MVAVTSGWGKNPWEKKGKKWRFKRFDDRDLGGDITGKSPVDGGFNGNFI